MKQEVIWNESESKNKLVNKAREALLTLGRGNQIESFKEKSVIIII